jgi:hypothetical protein
MTLRRLLTAPESRFTILERVIDGTGYHYSLLSPYLQSMVAAPKRSLIIGVVPDLPASSTMRNITSHYQTLAILDVGLTLGLSLWPKPMLLDDSFG